ncbi:MAG: site-specific integrase [Proteobacteria bacterium]|nr:site-specific integrase [Pseudomonadota bacterium]
MGELMAAWADVMEREARETLDRPAAERMNGRSAVRLRRKHAPEDADGNSRRATKAIRSERTIVVNRRTANAITRLVGGHPVADAKGAAESLEAEYIEHVRGEPAVTTLHLYLSTLRRAYVWGRANGLVRRVPEIAGYEFDPQRDTKYEKWTPNREDFARLLQGVDEVAGRRRRWARPVVSLLAGTGLRVGEVSSLRVGDFDLADRTLTVLRKGGEVSTLALTDEVVAAIGSLVEGRPPDERLVTARSDSRSGVPLLSNRVAKLLTAAAKKAGIPHRVTAHSLRRYASTLLFGAQDGEYKDMMGHSKRVADEAYRAERLDEQRAALTEARLLPRPDSPGLDGGGS